MSTVFGFPFDVLIGVQTYILAIRLLIVEYTYNVIYKKKTNDLFKNELENAKTLNFH